jgi:hypothetical protein
MRGGPACTCISDGLTILTSCTATRPRHRSRIARRAFLRVPHCASRRRCSCSPDGSLPQRSTLGVGPRAPPSLLPLQVWPASSMDGDGGIPAMHASKASVYVCTCPDWLICIHFLPIPRGWRWRQRRQPSGRDGAHTAWWYRLLEPRGINGTAERYSVLPRHTRWWYGVW